MNKNVPPSVLLIVLLLGYLAFILLSAQELPERVATHFGLSGHPDRWSERSSAIALMAGFGIGLPLLMVGLGFLVRLMPESMLNIPNKDYWLAPDRRDETYGFVFRQLMWLACLVVCLMGGMHWITLQAHRSTPVQMPTSAFWAVLGAFLAGMAVWATVFVLRFRRPRASARP